MEDLMETNAEARFKALQEVKKKFALKIAIANKNNESHDLD